MADDTKAGWLNWLAITTIIFSASATLSTFKGGGFSTKAVLAQTNAANQWAYFQSKSVKQHTCELQRDSYKLQLLTVTDSTVSAAYRASLDVVNKDIERYDQEKGEIKAAAEALELEKVDYQKRGSHFGLAVVYLQVAIMFSALAALLKKKPVWVLGVAVGSFGLFNFIAALAHLVH